MRIIPLLSFILFVQLGLVAALSVWNKDNLQTYEAKAPLLEIESGDLQKIVIEDKGKPELIIEKKDGAWKIPGQNDFPVMANKMERFLGEVLEIKKPYPVGKTRAAAKQFKVTSEGFEKKISFFMGKDKKETIYIGSSPMFRKVHVRKDGDDLIYEVNLSSYEATINASDWYDKTLLHLKGEEINKITTPSFVLVRKEGKMEVEDLSEIEEAVEEKANAMVSKLSGLTFVDQLGVEDKPEYLQATPALTFSIELKDGKEHKYIFSKPEKETFSVLKVSSHPYFFKIAQTVADELQKISRSELVREKKKEEPASENPENKEGSAQPVEEKTP